MKNEINYSEFIERYLDGEMSPDEKIWFEKEIRDNSDLEQEIQLRREVNEALKEDEVIQLRMELNRIHEASQVQESSKAPGRRIVRSLTTVVSIAAFVLLVFIGKNSIIGYSPEKIFSRYYQPYDMPVYRAGNTEADLLFRKALETYQNREFDKAITLFEEVLVKDDTQMDANLMSGISKIETERYSEANTNFQRIIDHQDNLFVEQAQWYLALSYLMTEETLKSLDLLQEIAQGEGYYKSEAKDILKKIR